MQRRERSGRTLALVGGGLLALWLLRHGAGLGGSADANTPGGAPSTRRPVVWVRANRIEIDGVVAELPVIVARCRMAGVAEVHATGDATTRVVHGMLAALRAAGVVVYAGPDLAPLIPSESVQ